jgi:CheY-like chemotaxis protein
VFTMSFQALIASGEESLVQRFSVALGDIGVNLQSFSHTGRALSVLSSHRFEAVLLDCDLEGGMDLVEVVREHPINERTLVLAFVTGSEDARSASRLGANFVVPKPINWELAKRTLRAAKTMIIRERRRQIRETVHVPATIRLEDRVLDCTISDLSEGGLALRTPAIIPSESSVVLNFTLPGSAHIICKGKIAWSTSKQAGVEFTYLPPESGRYILAWLSRHSPRRAQREPTDGLFNRAVNWGY